MVLKACMQTEFVFQRQMSRICFFLLEGLALLYDSFGRIIISIYELGTRYWDRIQ